MSFYSICGDKAKGITDLKNYLKHFGYLNRNHSSNGFNANIAAADDYFDEVTESAIKAYQLNNNLEATGRLNAETVSKMMMARCGVSDKIHGKARISILGKQLSNGFGLHESARYTFFDWSP